MQTILIPILVGVMLAAVVYFIANGLIQRRRTFALAALASKMGLRFSEEDSFDMPSRYAGFCIVRAGHSPCANNVMYGRVDGSAVRAFDFRYEVGHGTTRATRRYVVVSVESDLPLGEALLWHQHELDQAPLHAREARTHLGQWLCRGDEDAVRRLGGAASAWFADQHAGLESQSNVLMAFVPARRLQDLAPLVTATLAVMSSIGGGSVSAAQTGVANTAPA